MVTKENYNEFIKQAHRVGAAGLTFASSGNISWRVGDQVMISGTGSWVPELVEEKVSICKLEDGEILNGVKPSMEHNFHLEVMRKREDVNVVLHFQSPYATAVSCMKSIPENFNMVAEVPCHLGEKIPAIPYTRPGSIELAKAVVDAMMEHNSVLLLNHGVVVCGKDFNAAFERAQFFELMCSIIVNTRGEYNTLTEEHIDDLQHYVLGKKQK